jgi:hypothetical protein
MLGAEAGDALRLLAGIQEKPGQSGLPAGFRCAASRALLGEWDRQVRRISYQANM